MLNAQSRKHSSFADYNFFVLFLVFHSILFASLAQLVFVHHFPPSLQSANHENSGFLHGKPPIGCDCGKRRVDG